VVGSGPNPEPARGGVDEGEVAGSDLSEYYLGLTGATPTSDLIIDREAYRHRSATTLTAEPVKFDLRDVGGESYTSGVTLQVGGTCWAHGAMASLESNLMIVGDWIQQHGSVDYPQVDEYHLDWWNGFNEYFNADLDPPTGEGLVVKNGGDFLMAAAYFSRVNGGIDIFTALPTTRTWDTAPYLYQESYIVYYPREVAWLTTGPYLENINEVKRALMDYGAIATAISWTTDEFYEQEGSRLTFYQPPTSEYPPNHAVAIIGWDDTLTTPAPNKGAWLCKNSWGTMWAESGYFWVSYYDKICGKHPEMGAVQFRHGGQHDYKHVYYHDYHGWRDTKEEVRRAINAFEAIDQTLLTSVSFFTAVDDVGYEVTVFDTFESGEPGGELAFVTGEATNIGYHTIELDEVARFYPGDDFYLEVRLSTGGHAYDRTSQVSLLLGAAAAEGDIVSSSEPGQSYYLEGDTWLDLYDSDTTANFCIKGLTRDVAVIDASTRLGAAPLATNLSAVWGESVIDSYTWDFGDGTTSPETTPSHEYTEPGTYDVRVDMTTPEDDAYACTEKALVYVYADTIEASGDDQLPNDQVQVDLVVRNYLPLTRLAIPFTWIGPAEVTFDSISIVGTRCEGIAESHLVSYVSDWSAAAALIDLADFGVLPPGRGTVLRLYFTVESGSWPEDGQAEVWEYTGQEVKFYTHVGSYPPVIGFTGGCCVTRVGDVNQSGEDDPTIGDVSMLIDALFITSEVSILTCLAEADINQSGGSDPGPEDITIGDVAMLIDYLFITGESLGLPDCP
jgi:C1A family cysteine protease